MPRFPAAIVNYRTQIPIFPAPDPGALEEPLTRIDPANFAFIGVHSRFLTCRRTGSMELQCSVDSLDNWQTLESRSLFRNPHLEVVQERVSLPGDSRARIWTTVRRKKAVVIAPVTEAGRFVLIHEARIPVRKWLWEFPAGQVDETEPGSDVIR